MDTSLGRVGYLVNCNPGIFYKPFEWGLLILILFAAFAVTLSAIYSRAWSYGGVGVEVTKQAIIAFNVALVGGMIMAYVLPELLGFTARVVGSVIGALGVMVCANEILWLTKSLSIR